MLRAIAGVIVGFLVMSVLIAAFFFVCPTVLGWEKVFQPGTYWTTTWWNWSTLAWGFVAALIGGCLCRLIARGPRAGVVLAALLLVFGLIGGVMNIRKANPPARDVSFDGMSFMQVMEKVGTEAKEPNWYGFAKNVVGAAGILLGNRRSSRVGGSARPATAST